MSQPLIGNKNSWSNFEKYVLEIFNIALVMLQENTSLPIEEDSVTGDSLNRQLDICLSHAALKWEQIHETEIPTSPSPNLRQQPDLSSDEIMHDYERTKPDFQWTLKDRSGNSDNLNSIYKSYAIECKRIGKDISSRRNLNKEYVSKGILRFITNSHRYGQFTSSGLMIGYVQSSDLQVILDEINTTAISSTLPELVISPQGSEQSISRLDHKLQRPDIEPSPLELRHLWVDLRHHYEPKKTSAEKNESDSKKQKVQKPKSLKMKSK